MKFFQERRLWKARDKSAYAAFDRGALTEAVGHFEALAERFPERRHYEYMLGLTHKYLRNWRASLHHNFRAIRRGDRDQQAEHWNAAIAATALGNWQVAREQWRECGLSVELGDEPMLGDWGLCCVRLNAWADGETLFARRISPAVAVLLNVPLAESGYRVGDHVLVDGAKTGERRTADGSVVPVFNALARLQQSQFRTYVVTVDCADESDAQALVAATLPGIGAVEDWTDSVQFFCKKCSYGVPHSHEDEAHGVDAWHTERRFGVAASERSDVDALLAGWADEGRMPVAVDETEYDIPQPGADFVWWDSPNEVD